MRRKDARSGPATPRNARADASGTPRALACTDVRAREWDFVEGALPLDERTAVQTHLNGCEACRSEMTLCRNAEKALVSATAHIPAAGDLRAGFYARLSAEQRQPRRIGRPVALSALAASLLALALIRPMLRPHVAPPTESPASTTALSAPVNLASPAPAQPTIAEREHRPFHRNTDVAKIEADRMRTSGPSAALHSARASSTLRRFGSHRRIARLSGKPTLHASLRAATHPQPAVLAYNDAESSRSPVGTLAKASVKMPTVRAILQPTRPQAGLRDQPVHEGLLALSLMPASDGVSLEVTDQVRGFSNSTHVASDVEVQGETSTIHVEADGN